MKNSNPPVLTQEAISDMAQWLTQQHGTAPLRDRIMDYVRKRTSEAYEAKDTSRLPKIADIAIKLGCAKWSAQDVCNTLLAEGSLHRIQCKRGYRWGAVEWHTSS